MASFKYSFTVTLKPIMYKKVATDQYDATSQEVLTKLLGLSYMSPDGKFDLTLVSELTKNYNIHYHGIIKMPLRNSKIHCMKRFTDEFRNSKQLGFVNIKQIDDEPGWIDYISKDLHSTKIHVGRPPVIFDGLESIKDEEFAFTLHLHDQ